MVFFRNKNFTTVSRRTIFQKNSLWGLLYPPHIVAYGKKSPENDLHLFRFLKEGRRLILREGCFFKKSYGRGEEWLFWKTINLGALNGLVHLSIIHGNNCESYEMQDVQKVYRQRGKKKVNKDREVKKCKNILLKLFIFFPARCN